MIAPWLVCCAESRCADELEMNAVPCVRVAFLHSYRAEEAAPEAASPARRSPAPA